MSNYGDNILDTPGLVSYWRMGEAPGRFADSKGTNNATATGGTIRRRPAPSRTTRDNAGRFDGVDDYAQAEREPVRHDGDDGRVLAQVGAAPQQRRPRDGVHAELQRNDGGFLVDPDATQFGGTFAVGVGHAGQRNNVVLRAAERRAVAPLRARDGHRPSAATQITPYVDGSPVSYQKLDGGTGAGNFANSVLYFMSRAGQSLFGAGDLDEVAIFNRALTPSQIADHFGARHEPAPHRRLLCHPGTPNDRPGRDVQRVRLDGSGRDCRGLRVGPRRQRHLRGGQRLEPDDDQDYTTEGDVNVSLRVIDNRHGADTETKTVVRRKWRPDRIVHRDSKPAPAQRQIVSFNAGASSDSDGSIVKYEWDLDGNGSYETNTGATATTRASYAAPGTVQVGLRVTDNSGKTGTKPVAVSVQGAAYPACDPHHAGLAHYWRLGETSGAPWRTAGGTNNATISAAARLAFRARSRVTRTSALSFDGVNDYARANVNLSGTSAVTVEFWMKWDGYLDDDALAMEFTPNFNSERRRVPHRPERLDRRVWRRHRR